MPNREKKLSPAYIAIFLSLATGAVLVCASAASAQEEAGAAQKPAGQLIPSLVPAPVLPLQEPPTADGIPPLRNIELLNKLDDDRLPTRPRRFLRQRFKQVRRAQDEKILQLLLVCVGFVGAFVAILALRSMPPSRPGAS